MEIALEIKAGQARQDAMCTQELAGPEEWGSAECSQQHDTSKIKQESVGVLQGC